MQGSDLRLQAGGLASSVRLTSHEGLYSRLNQKGVQRILAQLQRFERIGKDVVLLCYEDIRKPDDWCHRRTFADWWMKQTGEGTSLPPPPTAPGGRVPA